jgi:predicted nucleotide-binding protein
VIKGILSRIRNQLLAWIIANAPVSGVASASGVPVTADRGKGFVVHGRNERARRAVFAFLRSLGLHPLEWLHAQRATGTPNEYVWNVVEAGLKQCATAVVVLTGDDLARLHPDHLQPNDDEHEKTPTPQPRQNVLIELGAVWARGTERVVVSWGRFAG